MLYIDRVRWKNFLSTGNVFLEVDLTAPGTLLIVGDNGTGKSTILDAVTFALYGKPYRRINRGQVVNALNGAGCLVEIDVRADGHSYTVSRGVKPSVFAVTRDGAHMSESLNRDQQSWLETHVLRCGYKSFCRVAVLGTATFTPFMQLPAWQRRELIEDLLDLKVFAGMNASLKVRTQARETEVNDLQSRRAVLDSSVKLIEKRRTEILAKNNVDVDEKRRRIADAWSQIEGLRDEEASLRKRWDDARLRSEEASKKQRKARDLEKLRGQIQTNRRALTKDMGVFKHDSCPVCLQSIGPEHREATLASQRAKMSELDRGLNLLEQHIASVHDELELSSGCDDELRDWATRAAVTVSRIESLITYVQELERDVSSIQGTEVDTAEEEALRAARGAIDAELAELKTLAVVHTAAQQLLRDEGIKSLLIQRYVPKINCFIAEYVRAMNFMCRFELDAEFNERVLSRGMDEFSYESFSEGQKQRIDLALLFTWREIARKRNSVSINLLILDEVFDRSLDTGGIEDVASIIKKLAERSKVVVISHRDQMTDKFSEVLKFSTKRNFSQMERC